MEYWVTEDKEIERLFYAPIIPSFQHSIIPVGNAGWPRLRLIERDARDVGCVPSPVQKD